MFIFTLQNVSRLLILIPRDLQKLDKQLNLWLEVLWSLICWWSKKWKSEYSEKDLPHFSRQEMSQCPVSSPFDLLNRTCHLLWCGLLSLGTNVHLQVRVYSKRAITFSPMSGGGGADILTQWWCSGADKNVIVRSVCVTQSEQHQIKCLFRGIQCAPMYCLFQNLRFHHVFFCSCGLDYIWWFMSTCDTNT